MVSLRKDTFLLVYVPEAGVWELIQSRSKFPLSADSSSAQLCERLTASAADSYQESNRVIGLAHIHLLSSPLTLIIGVQGGRQGRMNPTQSWTDGVFLQSEPAAMFKSISQAAKQNAPSQGMFLLPTSPWVFYSFFSFLLKTHLHV